LLLDVHISVLVLDTVIILDLTFLVVRLILFLLQILISNNMDFSKNFGIFMDYFGKSSESMLLY